MLANMNSASASSCVPDWPSDIFDNGYSGSVLAGASIVSSTEFSGGRPIIIAVAPTIKSQYSTQLAALGKDVKVSTSYISTNGLKIDSQLASLDPAALSSVSFSLFGPHGPAVPGLGRLSGLNGLLIVPFSFTPGAKLTTKVNVLTPGCDARTFTSATVEVPKYSLLDISAPSIQSDLKNASKDFTQLDNLNKLATILNTTTQQIDQSLQYTLPKVGEFAGTLSFFPDWRLCNAVTAINIRDYQQIPFKINNLSDSFVCTIPIYGYLSGKVFTLATTKFQYSAPIPKTPESVLNNPKKFTITCVKGKVMKKVTTTKPACPTGYKKKV